MYKLMHHQHIFIPLIFSLFFLLLSGCLISEIDEYRIILNEDGKSGVMYTIKTNIQSDQINPVKQQDDFDNLIRDWKSDKYLLNKMEEGVYVKQRKLSLKKGVLIWREKVIFADFHHLFDDVIKNDTLRIGFGKEEIVVKTNGEIIRTDDSTIVRWPLEMKKFILKIRKKEFNPTSDYAAKFRTYNVNK